MAKPKDDYLDDLECEECEEETEHYVYDDGHERDSSNNYKKCLECGKITYGI